MIRMTRRWFTQLSVASSSISVFVVLLTLTFPALAGRVDGRERGGGDVTGGSGGSGGSGGGGGGGGNARTTILPSSSSSSSLQSIAFGGNVSRMDKAEWYKRGIMLHILNVTGRRNGSAALQNGQTQGTVLVEEDRDEEESTGGNFSRREIHVRGTVPPDRNRGTSVRNTLTSQAREKIKFNPNEVTSGPNNDVLMLFALHNYTDMQVDEAELAVLLSCRPMPANQSTSSRKPEVRRVTITVYRETGNATSSGNASSSSSSVVDRSSRTVCSFQIRRTKWVKVLLKRVWIEEALSSPSRTLRLRLSYDKPDSIDVVTTDHRRGKERGRTDGRRLRTGTVGEGSPPTPQRRSPKEVSGNRKRKKTSPVLVVMKKEKLLSNS